MQDLIVWIVGWIPAVVFPAATAVQLQKAMKATRADGLSALSWILFGLANVSLYVFAEKYLSIQALLSMLLTAVLDFVLVGRILYLQKRTS